MKVTLIQLYHLLKAFDNWSFSEKWVSIETIWDNKSKLLDECYYIRKIGVMMAVSDKLADNDLINPYLEERISSLEKGLFKAIILFYNLSYKILYKSDNIIIIHFIEYAVSFIYDCGWKKFVLKK